VKGIVDGDGVPFCGLFLADSPYHHQRLCAAPPWPGATNDPPCAWIGRPSVSSSFVFVGRTILDAACMRFAAHAQDGNSGPLPLPNMPLPLLVSPPRPLLPLFPC
jgi:hypothetical protein